MSRIVVSLDSAQCEELIDLARAEHRHAREQATILIGEGLLRHKLMVMAIGNPSQERGAADVAD